MAAGKKKPVRWTIPDVKEAPPRALEAHEATPSGRDYPSAAEMMACGPEMQAWLKNALRAIVQPAAVASALTLGVTGCTDVAEILSQGTSSPAPVFVGGATTDKPATLTPIGSPTLPTPPNPLGGGVVMNPIPDKPDPTAGSVPPCPLPPLGGTAVGGEPPAVTTAPPPTPPAHPPAVRGRIRPIRPPAPPPPPVPAVDPPTLDGDVAMVHPEPPPMPGGLRAVDPSDGGTE
jgi:hypothetical protein